MTLHITGFKTINEAKEMASVLYRSYAVSSVPVVKRTLKSYAVSGVPVVKRTLKTIEVPKGLWVFTKAWLQLYYPELSLEVRKDIGTTADGMGR